MHVPLQAALYGATLVSDLIQRVTAPPPATSVPRGASSAFQDTLKLANLVEAVGSKLSSVQHKRLDELVAAGDIPHALQLLEQVVHGIPVSGSPTTLNGHGLASMQMQPSLLVHPSWSR